jgi:predicted dehydrogenase
MKKSNQMGPGNLRVGIVGLGQISAEVHVGNLMSLPGVVISAMADPAEGARSRAARLCPGARLFESAEEMVESRLVDALVIASPTGDHARHAMLAIERRLPFYVEKPLAADLASGVRVCEAAENAHVPGAMGFNYRFHPRVAQLRKSLNGVERVNSRFTIAPRDLPLWKRGRATGGGVLLDLGTHHIDLVSYVLQSEARSVAAKITSERSEADCAELEIVHENGVRAFSTFSFCRDETDVLSFETSRGRIEHNRYAPFSYPVWPVTGFLMYLAERRRSPWKEVSFRRSMAAWVASIRSGQKPPATLRDGLEALRVVCAAEQSSAAGGTPVAVEEVAERLA